MFAEWSAECSATDPVLVVPWKDPNGQAAFVDLQANPYDLDAIPEAEEHPPVMQALRALNAPRSPVFTAKCDAWPLGAEELAQLQQDLDTASTPASGFASYIDLIWRDRAIFTSFHHQEQVLRRLIRLADALDRPHAALDCVLRPALVDLDVPQEGYAVSLYIKAIGDTPQEALHEWATALEAVVALVRGKGLARRSSSKTPAP
jgi:hypothetical protein